MKTNSYRYAALSEDSYNSLAAFASTIPAQVTLFPALHIIVVANWKIQSGLTPCAKS